MITQLCYASVAVSAFDETALQALLEKARANNASQGITGLLLYGEGRFVQLLEGEHDVIEGLYRKIANDTRHQRLFELYRQSVSTRDFPNWSMAFERLADFQPEFLLDCSTARSLITMFLAKGGALTGNSKTIAA